jgi:LDH2 family malate/lactate/ureidoglycolate dehydrogenase
MWVDTIVEEVRTAREAHAARFDDDLEAIYRDLQAQEQQSKRQVVSLPPNRSVRQGSASAKPGVEVADPASR